MYIADTFNHAVRVVAEDGTITTFAGNLGQSYTAASPSFEGVSANAPSALLSRPYGVAWNPITGSIYIVENGCSTVHVICGWKTGIPYSMWALVGSSYSAGLGGDGSASTSVGAKMKNPTGMFYGVYRYYHHLNHLIMVVVIVIIMILIIITFYLYKLCKRTMMSLNSFVIMKICCMCYIQ